MSIYFFLYLNQNIVNKRFTSYKIHTVLVVLYNNAKLHVPNPKKRETKSQNTHIHITMDEKKGYLNRFLDGRKSRNNFSMTRSLFVRKFPTTPTHQIFVFVQWNQTDIFSDNNHTTKHTTTTVITLFLMWIKSKWILWRRRKKSN